MPADNTNFPPVYKRLRDRAIHTFLPIALLCQFADVAIEMTARACGVKGEFWDLVGDAVFVIAAIPMTYYLIRMLIIKLRAIYAKSPLCPLCAATMIASDPTAASVTPADPTAIFACPRCHHAATRAELKAAWRDVT